MEYLRGNATASAIGLFVICEHLSHFDHGRLDEELRSGLQPLRDPGRESSERGSVLAASLAVGEGLGLLSKSGPAGPWLLEHALQQDLRAHRGDAWVWFRGE